MDSVTFRCHSCGTLNRAPAARSGQTAKCGQCGEHTKVPEVSAGALTVSDATFDSVIKEADRTALVEFWSPTCGHCVRMGPVLDGLARELSGRVRVAKLDITNNPRTASLYEIRSTPAFVVFRGGREAARFVGAMSREEMLEHVKAFV